MSIPLIMRRLEMSSSVLKMTFPSIFQMVGLGVSFKIAASKKLREGVLQNTLTQGKSFHLLKNVIRSPETSIFVWLNG